jgi:hypothetical protein
MVTYVVNYTDTDKLPINVEERDINHSLPIAIFGRRRLQYGEEMNENLLHLLENFSCPDANAFARSVDPSVPLSGTPQLDPNEPGGGALTSTLANAIEGQLWYNSTNHIMYKKVGPAVTDWVPLSDINTVASISGSMLTLSPHGTISLPLPIGNDGYEFTVEECYWIVSPRQYPAEIDGMKCSVDLVDDNPVVTMYYWVGPVKTPGHFNYKVIGIKSV